MNIAKRSATMMILANDLQDGEMKVLLLKRSEHSRFLPSSLVFPGGLEEDEDHLLPSVMLGDRLSKSLINTWSAWGMESEVQAYQSLGTALRETQEECGLALSSEDLLAQAPHQLVAHWLTPFALKKRYDTFFWGIVIGHCSDELTVDGIEISGAQWWSPYEAVKAYEVGDLDLAVPTFMILSELSMMIESAGKNMNASHALQELTQSPLKDPVQPILNSDNGVKLYLPGDQLYGEYALNGEVEAKPQRPFWQVCQNHLTQITVQKKGNNVAIKRWRRVFTK